VQTSLTSTLQDAASIITVQKTVNCKLRVPWLG
jgi:hypothetical protein